MKFYTPRSPQDGSALISMIIVLPFLILICGLFMNLAVSSLTLARKDQAQTHAQLAGDAGIDYALQIINQDTTWTSTGGEVTLHDENNVRTTYQVELIEIDADHRTLRSVGRTYQPAASAIPIATKTINADLRPIKSAGYSIVTGVGGLFMANSAKIVGGDVFVNGEITMSNTTQIGLSTNPVNVSVANQNCPKPADANYPRLCTATDNVQPINIASPAKIYGSVKANYQTDGSNMVSPGLVASSGVDPLALPTHDREAQKSAATTALSGTDASCNTVGGTRNWPANVKISGNVLLSKNCKVTLNGNVWITGTLTMSQSAQLIVSDTLASTVPDVMVDGPTVSLSNSSALVSNTSKTGLRLLTYWSRAGCSPDCTAVTGTDLYDSRNDDTIVIDNTVSAPESTFYARWTRVNIVNSGGIGAIIGQTIQLNNSATITFGSQAATCTTFWVLDGYRRTF